VPTVRFEDSTSVQLQAPFGEFSFRERIFRSMKIFGIFLFAAVISVLIPIAHFILVPGFLVISFVASVLKFKQTSFIDLSNCKCPRCSEPLNEKTVFQSKARVFSKLYYFNCRTNMKLEP